MRHLVWRAALCLAVAMWGPACGPKSRVIPGDDLLYLEGATLLDGTGAPPVSAAVVVIDGERIAAVGRSGEIHIPKDARRRDLRGNFLLPGFINMRARVEGGEAGRARLERMLYSGITTARVSAPTPEALVELRRLVASGKLDGPRLIAVAELAVMGRMDEDGVRAAVASPAKAGFDAVELDASIPAELVGSAVQAAHAQGLQAIGRLGLDRWTQAAAVGIDTLEPDWSAPTLLLADMEGPEASEMIWTIAQQAASVFPSLQTRPEAAELARRLHEAGAVLVAGGDLHAELALMAGAGIPAPALLAIASQHGAEALGLLTETGTVAAGKRADLLVLAADPLADIHATLRVRLVIQAGRLIEPR
jgi:imidazolonepropionase-like amidohydrolase